MEKPETLDIDEAVARWDEILGRTEAGESFIISVGGEPKVRLEPIRPDEPSAAVASDRGVPHRR